MKDWLEIILFFLGYWPIYVFLIVVIGGGIWLSAAKKKKNREAAESGEDKRHIREAAEQVLDGNGNYRMLYAYQTTREWIGSPSDDNYTTVRHPYVAAYENQTLYVIPLSVEKKRLLKAGRPEIFEQEELGLVDVKVIRKNDDFISMTVRLYNKQGLEQRELYVDAENWRNSECPVNIVQREECAAFERFITSMAQSVATENPGMDELIDTKRKTSFYTEGGLALAVLGALGIIAYPTSGSPLLFLIMCLIGVLMSIWGKLKWKQNKVYLLISIVCFLLCAGIFLWRQYT